MLHNCKRNSKIIEVDSVNAGVTAERIRKGKMERSSASVVIPRRIQRNFVPRNEMSVEEFDPRNGMGELSSITAVVSHDKIGASLFVAWENTLCFLGQTEAGNRICKTEGKLGASPPQWQLG